MHRMEARKQGVLCMMCMASRGDKSAVGGVCGEARGQGL